VFLLGFLVAAAYWPGLLDAALVPRWAVMAAGVPAAFLLEPLLTPRLSLAAAAVALALAAPLLWAPSWPDGLDEAIHVAILAGAFVLAYSAPTVQHLWRGFALGICVSAALALLQVMGWEGVQQSVPPAGLFANKNMLAEAAALALLASIGFAGRWRWLALGCLLAVGLTGSRSAWAALIIAWALATRTSNRWASLSLLAMVVVLGAVTFYLSASLPDGMGLRSSAGERLQAWGAVLGSLTLWGHGLGSYALSNPWMEFAHNEYLQLVYEGGALALVPIGYLLWLIVRRLPDGGDIAWLVLVAVATMALLSFPLHMPATAFCAAVAAGRLARGRGALCDAEHAGRTLLRSHDAYQFGEFFASTGARGCGAGDLPAQPHAAQGGGGAAPELGR